MDPQEISILHHSEGDEGLDSSEDSLSTLAMNAEDDEANGNLLGGRYGQTLS